MLKYLRKIEKSGLFDRRFYLDSTPNLHYLAKLFPERHYILRGETVGLCPNQNFSPLAYLHKNPALKAVNLPPFMHYIDTGRAANLSAEFSPSGADSNPELLPKITPKDFPAQPARFAIVVHVYYYDLWPEISRAIKQQAFPFDLFITLNQFSTLSANIIQAIQQDFPAARIWIMPNHGRDLFAFIHLVNSGILSPYEAVCKLHTKKSPHRHDGNQWRSTLINGVLGNPDQTMACLGNFTADNAFAFWTANGQHYQGEKWWGQNRQRTANLIDRLNIKLDGSALSFAAGSIYWVKPVILRQVQKMQLCYDDFEPEQGQIDGTTAHALERSFGFLARASDTTIIETQDLIQRQPICGLYEREKK